MSDKKVFNTFIYFLYLDVFICIGYVNVIELTVNIKFYRIQTTE